MENALAQSKKPLIVAGNGVRLAGCVEAFGEFITRTQIPFVTTWTGADLLPTDHPQNYGVLGMCGQIGANRAVSECDFLLSLGSHLSIPQTSTLFDQFAPNAKRFVVDIDQNQLDNLTIEATGICKHLFNFFEERFTGNAIDWGIHLKAYNVPPDIGSYRFNSEMTRMLPPGVAMVIDGGGTALYTGFQSSHVKEGSRLICSTSMSAMGSGLPEAVGACLARSKSLTTCLIGDGSLMLNIQELQTIKTHNLPIKVFVLNNSGYHAIRITQKGFLEGRYFGVGGGDLEFPSISKVAATFGIHYVLIDSENDNEEILGLILDHGGPVVCEVMCPPDQPMLRQVFKNGKPQPLAEMACF